MKILLIVAVSLGALAACDFFNEVDTAVANAGSKKIWVYVQFNVPKKSEGVDTYWYHGQISETLYKRMAANEIASGFLLLEDVRYWDSDREVYETYEDDQDSGDLVFRVEHVVKITPVKRPPPLGASTDGDAADQDNPAKASGTAGSSAGGL